MDVVRTSDWTFVGVRIGRHLDVRVGRPLDVQIRSPMDGPNTDVLRTSKSDVLWMSDTDYWRTSVISSRASYGRPEDVHFGRPSVVQTWTSMRRPV